MSYRPQIQPPPPIGVEDFDLWMKRTIETVTEYLVKDRKNGRGLSYDSNDNQQISYRHMFLRSGR